MRSALATAALAFFAFPTIAASMTGDPGSRYNTEWGSIQENESESYFSNDDIYITHILNSLPAEQLVQDPLLRDIEDFYHRTRDYRMKEAIVYTFRKNLSNERVFNLWMEAIVEGVGNPNTADSQDFNDSIEVRRMAAMVMGDYADGIKGESEMRQAQVAVALLDRIRYDESEPVSGASALAFGNVVAQMPDGVYRRSMIVEMNEFFQLCPLRRNYLAYCLAVAMGTVGDNSSLFPLMEGRFRGFAEHTRRQFFLSIRKITGSAGGSAPAAGRAAAPTGAGGRP